MSLPVFKTNLQSEGRVRPPGVNGTAIYFSMDRKETLISEAAKTDLLTVLSSFGETLGLLAGVSVLSLLELFIWGALFVAELATRKYGPKIGIQT